MSTLAEHINELKAAEAFSKQSDVFDESYGADSIIQYKRERVRQLILQQIQAPATLLEINCGTGEDALFFARNGFSVHATDISEGMLQKLWLKKNVVEEGARVTSELCSFTELGNLRNKGPFDVIYSNFGGLNCTPEIRKVLFSFEALLKPGGTVTLVLISRFCLWETLLVFRGKFKTAFRRFFVSKGRKANVEGKQFYCWYYGISDVRKNLPPSFEVTATEGLCVFVPPSYIKGFAEKRPRLFQWLKNKEDRLKNRWPWKFCGDYIVVTLRKMI